MKLMYNSHLNRHIFGGSSWAYFSINYLEINFQMDGIGQSNTLFIKCL